MEVAKTMGVGRTLKGYKGKFTSIYVEQINHICTKFKDKMDEEVDVTMYDQGGARFLDWTVQFPDLANVVNTVDDIR
jgi:hypothetical protein